MALTPSKLTLQIKSQGIKQAADDLKSLAEAAKSVDAETRSFVIAQAKLQESQVKTKETTRQTSQAVIEQKRDYETWRMAGSQIFLQQQRDVEMWKIGVTKAAAEASAALKQYNETQKSYANLWKEMDTRKGLEQAQQYKLYTIEVAKAAAATKEAEKITKAHGDALEMNKKFDAERAKQIARSTAEQEKHNRSLEEGSKRGSIFNNTLKSMAVAASAYVGVNFVKSVFEQADAWSMMQSKLNLAVGSMGVAKNVQQDLFNMSQKLRVPIEETAKLFTRMSVPLQKMGLGVKDTEQVVGAFSTALKLAGATGQEASSAMLQFSQSINAGRLNGGEFNSIAEASPNILRAIEAELIRTGKGAELASKGLKKMASEGKITTEVLVAALKNAAPQWEKDFNSLPLTVDGALTRIKNAWAKAIGEIGQDTKFNEELAKSIKVIEGLLPSIAKGIAGAFTFLVNNGDKILAVFTGITGAVALFKASSFIQEMFTAYSAIDKVTKAAGGLRAALALIGITPLGIALTALGGVIATVIYNWDALTKSVSEVNKVNETVMKDAAVIIRNVQNENLALEVQIDKLRVANGEQAKYNKTKMDGTKISAKSELDELNRGLKVLENNLKSAEKAQKDLSKLSVFDPNKISKSDKAKEDIEQTKNAIEMQKRMIAIATADFANNERLESERKEGQRVADLQKKVESIYSAARSEKQILDEQYADKVEAAKRSAKDLGMNEFYLKQDLLNIEKWYLEEKAKSKSGKESSKAADEEREAVKSLNVELQSLIKQKSLLLKLGVDGDKLLPAQKKLIEMELDGSSKAQIDLQKKIVLASQQNKIVEDSFEAIRKIRKEELERTDKMYEQNASAKSQLETLQRQLEEEDSIKISKAEQNVLDAEREVSMLNAKGIMGLEIALANERLNIARQTLDVTKQLEKAAEIKVQAEKYENLYQSANKKIADGLYAAIGKGGDNAIKKLIQDVKSSFARLVLNPIIQPISQIGASIVSPNAASATSLAGSISSLASSAGSAWNFISNPATWGATAAASLASGVGAVGSAIGSEFMLGVSSMMQGGVASGAMGVVASGLSAIATVAPYLAAAGLLYKGLSMGDKQITGQTVTGNLGTDNLSRNVSWKQDGGFLRSDRADTWRYGLKDSTAIQDGKSYVDTANLTADKALLNQLNGAYDSLKQNTASLAKSLGISSEVILKRNDSISFAFGKDSQETSSNITKAFESVANVMATDLLKGFETLAKVGETSYQTLTRLVGTIGSVNDIFGMLGFKLYDINAAGVKSADALITLYGGLEKFQSITKSYYDNFYTESEKTKKSLEIVKDAIKALGVKDDINTRAEYRALVDREKVKGNDALVKSLMELSSAFASVVQWEDATTIAATALEKNFETAKQAFEDLSKDAERWLNIRSQAASLKDSIDSTLGNPKKDPAARIKKLWDAMSSDVSPEQKLTLANELKDLIIDKYQVEKESIQKLIDFGKQLRGYTDSLKLGNLSPLTTTQKLAEAQKQFQDTLNKAMGGDSTAQQALTGKADAYLQLAQTAYASSGAYTSIFENVTGALDALGLSSMSAEDKTLSLAQTQADELLKLRDYAAKMETLSDSYYKTNLSLLAEQTSALSKLYDKMGVFDGIATNLAALPAEIAANLSEIMGGNSSGDYITSLYNSLAGKSGDMIDKQGYDYWTNELNVYGKDWVNRSFLESVKVVTGGGVAGIQPRTDNTEVVAQLAAVKEELVAMRVEAQKQTGDLIVATYDANSVNAATVVEGTTQSLQESVWAANTTPSLI